MAKHAMHNASASDYWLDCGYYYHHKKEAVANGEDYDPDNHHSIRGNQMHDVAEEAMKVLLTHDTWSAVMVESEVADQIEALGFDEALNADDADQLTIALCGVLELIDTYDAMSETPLVIGLELQVPLSHEPESQGTIDVSIEGHDFLATVDYKFGQGEVTPDASQLLIYAANRARQLKRAKRRVILGIMQPRLSHEVITRETTWSALVEFRGFVNHTVKRQVNGLVYGPSSIQTCTYCPFRDRCAGYVQLLTNLGKRVVDARTDQQIEWLVVNKGAIEEGLDILAGAVKTESERFPDWSRKEVANALKWNPTFDPGKIAHDLRLKGLNEPYQLRTPGDVLDENPDLAGTVKKYTLERGTHVRLFRPTSAPDLKAIIQTREIADVIARREAAAAAKREAKEEAKAEKDEAKQREREEKLLAREEARAAKAAERAAAKAAKATKRTSARVVKSAAKSTTLRKK